MILFNHGAKASIIQSDRVIAEAIAVGTRNLPFATTAMNNSNIELSHPAGMQNRFTG